MPKFFESVKDFINSNYISICQFVVISYFTVNIIHFRKKYVVTIFIYTSRTKRIC